MRSSFLTIVLLLGTTAAHASFVCGGALTNAQTEGLEKLLNPRYSPMLTNVGTGSAANMNMSKNMTKAEISSLASKPRVASSATLTDTGSKFLKEALNTNAQSSIPGWLATAVGFPNALVGVTADVAIQLVNGTGDAGRLAAANLSGRVGPGSILSVIEGVAKDSAGQPKFVYYYTHTTVMDGKSVQSLLRACRADIIQK